MKIEKVKQLLSRYYDGTASPEETDGLMQYFMTAENLPEDLQTDAMIFRAMANHKPAAMPADMEQRILNATVGKKRRLRPLYWAASISAAAAVALIVTIGAGFLSDDKEQLAVQTPANMEQPVVNTVAENSRPAEESVTVPEEKPESIGTPDVDTKSAKEVKIISERKRPALYADEVDAQEGSYREVTDSAEVQEITTRLFASLDASMEKAERGIRETESAIEMIRNPFASMSFSDDDKQ